MGSEMCIRDRFKDGGVKTSPIQISNLHKRRPTARDPWSTKTVGYRLPLPHNLSHCGASIRNDIIQRCHANLINRQASCHQITQSPGEILKIRINSPVPPFSKIQKNPRYSKIPTNSALTTFLRHAFVSKRAGASVVVKN